MGLLDAYYGLVENVAAARARGRNFIYGSPEERQVKAMGLLGEAPSPYQLSPDEQFGNEQIPGLQTAGSGLLGSDMGLGDRMKFRLGMLGTGYQPGEVGSVMQPIVNRQKYMQGLASPTSLQKSFEYYQGLPQQQQQQLIDYRKSGAANISLGPKLPTGYQWRNPDDPGQGVTPIPGGPVTKPSAVEAKQLSQAEMSQAMLNEIRSGIDAGVDISNPFLWAEAEMAAMPIVAWMTSLSPDEAKTASNIKQFENQFLAMMRGAQVGPAEQKMFRKQLPQLGQSDELFEANFAASQNNLRIMVDRMSQMRNITPPTQGLSVPPGWEELP